MKVKTGFLMIGMAFLLFAVGTAGAQILPAPQAQQILPWATIPKFTSQLPVAGDISVVNATSSGTTEYSIHIREFEAQILPVGFKGPSSVWGYLTDADVNAQQAVRQSYLGPAVIAERGVPAYPTYLNELPLTGSKVQPLLPIDMTLDWANPTDIVCGKNPITGDYTNPACGTLPSYTGPQPVATHIHGGEVEPAFDGGPDAWETPGGAIRGIGFPGNRYTYPNEQQEATIWFHDHALGITRLNVYAGMAGIYPIVDPANPPRATMPAFPQYDIPLIIQDRTFDVNGQIFYNLASNPQPNPTVHPYWIPEFIGDTIVVNGKTWPNLNVEARQYRFRLLNGSNARFYDLTLSNGAPFLVIATDGGYLVNAVSTPNVIIGPGERYEVIVNFTGLAVGTQIIMKNSARTPFPGGARPTRNGTDTIMRFTVTTPLQGSNTTIAAGTPIRPTPLEPILNGWTAPAVPPAAPAGNILRQLTLNEVIGPGGPLELVVNNSKFNLGLNIPGCPGTSGICRETELPAVGDTEVWDIINITADAHPMHTHLVTFQIVSRTPFQAARWINQYDALMLQNGVLPGGGPPKAYNVRNADGAIGGNPAIGPFLQPGKATLPLAYEKGWKDTAVMYPGEVTRIVVRWAPQDVPVPVAGVGTPCTDLLLGTSIPETCGPGSVNACEPGCNITPGANLYPFDPTNLFGADADTGFGGVGYVWHCHIIDHEDNEMMRSYTPMTARQPIN